MAHLYGRAPIDPQVGHARRTPETQLDDQGATPEILLDDQDDTPEPTNRRARRLAARAARRPARPPWHGSTRWVGTPLDLIRTARLADTYARACGRTEHDSRGHGERHREPAGPNATIVREAPTGGPEVDR